MEQTSVYIFLGDADIEVNAFVFLGSGLNPLQAKEDIFTNI
jgi:hypothetical protein